MPEMIKIQVSRFNPETDKESRLETYSLQKEPGMRILGALKAINGNGHDISYRYGCEEWECGSCAILANGIPMLACKTEVQDGMILEPLPDFPIGKDLIVDRSKEVNKQAELYELPEKKLNAELTFEQQNHMWNAITCMECCICLASCPILHTTGGSYKYSGPEFMVQLFRTESDARIEKGALATSVKEGIWECTACRHCVENCPQRIPILDEILELRQGLIEKHGSLVPATIRDMNESLFNHGNPYGMPRAKRMDWAKEIRIPEGKDILYFVGCEQCYNARDQLVARAMLDVFETAGVNFGTLGINESNAGDPAFSTGEMGLFEELATRNIKLFDETGVKRIVTTSPHDFHMIRNQYPSYGGKYDVLHYSQFLKELIDNKTLMFTNMGDKKVTFHDPCYLGRYNKIYETPREVLGSIPGLKVVEMRKNRSQAECCGGGGGGNWLDVPGGERIGERRVLEAVETGAEILVVACPLCLAMFEDAVKSKGLEQKLEVKQLIEVVRDAIA